MQFFMKFFRFLRAGVIAPMFNLAIFNVATGLRFVVVVLLGLVLSGCSLGSLPSFGGGMFGSSEKKQEKKTYRGLSEERLLAAAKLDATTEGSVQAATTLCSKVKIWDADKFLTVYEVGQYGDGLAVKFRGELTKAARECQFQPGLVHVKYGFAGRVLLGPKGQPGAVNLPILVHLTDKAGKKIKTEKLTVPVTIEPGKHIGYFSLVRRIDIPLTGGQSGKSFKVFIGFEKVDQS